MNNVWMNLILAIQLLSGLAVIGLVLVQHGKGADMGASFGGGASGSLFGATGSANFLSRSTAIAAAVFFVCTLFLAYWGTARVKEDGGGTGTSVLERGAAAPAVPSALPASAAVAGAVSGAASGAVSGAVNAATSAASAATGAPAAAAAAASAAAAAASSAINAPAIPK